MKPNHGGSYKHFPDWIKNKKASISPINKKDKCFQYAIPVTLNHEQIKKGLRRITKIKQVINKKLVKNKFLSEKNDWKKFEKNIVAIALNVLYSKKEKIYPAYISKHNSNCGK